ncbi:STAS domain-containing protein [Rhizobium terrae]|uniref:STAS domain-containing protein n=1 Tax=Rhizobium terrae TaxID=2171756 RepID=UPI000E3B574E|nr:STAS domain-containing protein [Rhizobium terrae]
MTASNVKEDYLCLPDNLTVRAITTVQQEVLRFIDKNQSIAIELSDDCQVDISFIQLMEAARIYAGTAGKRIALKKPASGPMLDVLQRSGFLEGLSAEDAKFWLHQGGIQ